MDVCEDGGTDLCKSLSEAGRLGLRERQEKGLLPERSESWNVAKERNRRNVKKN